jgi:hypothetical protein
MKLRNEWMTDNEFFGDNYPNNLILDDAVRRFEIQRDQSLDGRNAIIDGVEERVVVQVHTNMLNQTKYDYKIHCNRDSLIRRGSIVDVDNKVWLVVSKVFDNLAYKTTSIIETNNVLTVIKDGILHKVPCVIESSVQLYRLGIEETRYINMPETTIVCFVPDNEITSGSIKRDDIYKLSPVDNYKVIDINRVLFPGILVLGLEYSQESQPDYNYTIEILNGAEIDIEEETSLQLNIQVKLNGEVVSPTPPIIYETIDEYVVNVDDKGLVTAYDVIDSCVISVMLEFDQDVSADIVVNVIDDPYEDDYSVEINGSDIIYCGYTEQYSAIFRNNGIPMEDVVSSFWLTADDGVNVTDLAEIITQDENSNTCQIKGNSTGYVILWIKDENEYIDEFKRIQIRSLF